MNSNLRCEHCIHTTYPPFVLLSFSLSPSPSPSLPLLLLPLLPPLSPFSLSFPLSPPSPSPSLLPLLLIPLPSSLPPFPLLLLQNRRLSSKKRKKLEDQQQGNGNSGREGGSSEGSSSPMDSPAVTSTTHTPPAQEKRWEWNTLERLLSRTWCCFVWQESSPKLARCVWLRALIKAQTCRGLVEKPNWLRVTWSDRSNVIGWKSCDLMRNNLKIVWPGKSNMIGWKPHDPIATTWFVKSHMTWLQQPDWLMVT